MKSILELVVETFKDVPGVEAIVLGGSRARDTHDASSDFDFGLYINEMIDLDLLEDKAKQVDDKQRDMLLARPGQWGKWVNGGCWLEIHGQPVDIILRDLKRVEYYLNQVNLGQLTAHYQTGHPHAYFNAMYVGELAISNVLWSKSDQFLEMKTKAEVYPQKLKQSILDWFSFEASFSLSLAQKSIPKRDMYYINAHIVRSISSLNQLLFALNHEYCINEKAAVRMIDAFAIKPENYQDQINVIFSKLFHEPEVSCRHLEQLIQTVLDFI